MKTFKLLPAETVLEDDYPVHGDYVYIIDNVFARCPIIEGTVADLKRATGAKEIRRCEIFAHDDARLGDKVEP